jgi:hypothetical protein
MAVEYMRLGEYGPALQHIKQSLAHVEPDTSYVHLLYKYEIRCRAMLGDTAGALDACDRGITLFPDYPDLHHIKGILLLQTGAFCGAREALRQALDIGVSPPGYHTESGFGTYLTLAALGQLCQETGEDNEAIACYTRAAQLHPAPGHLIARLLRSFKCAGREHELTGWLKAHLPQITSQLPGLPALLLREGCFAAAAELLVGAVAPDTAAMGGGVAPDAVTALGGAVVTDTLTTLGGTVAPDTVTALGGVLAPDRTTGKGGMVVLDAAESSGGTLSTPESAAYAGAADSNASLRQLLHRVNTAPADRLEHEDIAALLRHPSVSVPDSTGPAADSGLQSSRVWLLLADGVLASLPPSTAYSPAAERARLALPLPRIQD